MRRMGIAGDIGALISIRAKTSTRSMIKLSAILTELQTNPRSRRAIIQMWDPVHDMGKPPIPAKDLPCNTTIKFSMRQPIGANPDGTLDPQQWDGGLNVSHLNMVVFNRSNDIIMGCYGANAVHLSVLQEYMASMLGVRVGWYEQVSCDWHAYKEEFDGLFSHLERETEYRWHDPYTAFAADHLVVKPLVDDPATFDEDLAQLLAAWRGEGWLYFSEYRPHNPFLGLAAVILLAYHFYRDNNDPILAYHMLDTQIEIHGRIDWLVAGRDWMRRRVITRSRKEINEIANLPGISDVAIGRLPDTSDSNWSD
jgi:hypothetical protein